MPRGTGNGFAPGGDRNTLQRYSRRASNRPQKCKAPNSYARRSRACAQSQSHLRPYEPDKLQRTAICQRHQRNSISQFAIAKRSIGHSQAQNVAALIEAKAMSLASSNGVTSWARAKEPERRRFRQMARERIGEAMLNRIAAGRHQPRNSAAARSKPGRPSNDSSAARERKAASGLLP